MADWISPDGFTDTSGDWSDETKAYDGDTGTYAHVPQNANAWCNPLQLDFSTNCTSVSKIRIWISMAADADFTAIQVRVYDGVGGEELVLTGEPSEGAYVEANVSSVTTVNYATIRFQGKTVKYGQQRVHEFQCYGEGGPSPPSPGGVAAGMRLNARRRRLLHSEGRV